MIVDGIITPDIVRSGVIDTLLKLRYNNLHNAKMYRDIILMNDKKASKRLLTKYFDICNPTSMKTDHLDRALLDNYKKIFGAKRGKR